MKHWWNKTKEFLKRKYDELWAYVFRCERCVYLFFAIVIMFLSYILYMNSQHSRDHSQWQKEKALLELRVNVGKDMQSFQGIILKDQDKQMGEMIDMIMKQGTLLNDLDDNLRMSKQELWRVEILYKYLVEYMKKIGEWPPKAPSPLDPDKIAGSEASFYEAH